METPYDWITVAIFAGLIVLFMQRSTNEQSDQDNILHYLAPSVGCMATNYFGNEAMEGAGSHLIALILLAATVGYIVVVLKPFNFSKKS